MAEHLYRSYRFLDKDPIIDKIRTAVQDSGKTNLQIHEKSGVAIATLHNWFKGKTRRPQFATVAAVLRSIGKDVVVVDKKPNGH
jgi:DNA-binding phage protein